tara:strand:+ start:14944 stop:17988 length:3045 start_codon:yes stop_codon:yes gene_type:complete
LPKQVLQIKSFEGGINKRNDPRDIKDNQQSEAKNVDVSNLGKIVMPGEGKSTLNVVNSLGEFVSPTNDISSQQLFENDVPISDGYGIFSFVHDFNNEDTPQEINTEFICINDGADIKAWPDNSYPNIFSSTFKKIISLGTVHSTSSLSQSSDIEDDKRVKPIFYKADNGLRVCDANFSEVDSNVNTEEALTDGTDSTDPAETSITVETELSLAFSINEYIKINSEVMKVSAIPNANTLTVERGRFGSKIQQHITASDIFKINVPKIFTHINRPMLRKAEGSANVNINRWLEDIQVPEAPKYGALTVFRNNIIGQNSSALSSDTEYPSEPEKVNVGISLNTIEENSKLTLHKDDVVTSESTGLETVLILQLADSIDPTSEIDVKLPQYNFAIGKFIVISDATGDGVNLNGIHEIVGFGSETGQIKIVADVDAVGYTCTGQEKVILEDEFMDDNLKQKYVLGMSFLYDGGGTELQESNITMGLANDSDSLLGIDSTIPAISNWNTTDDSSFGNPQALKSTVGDNDGYRFLGNGNIFSTATGTWLFYDHASDVVEASTTYYVSGAIKFTKCNDVNVKFYVGIGPGATDPTASGFTGITVNEPENNTTNDADPAAAAATGIVEFFGEVTTGSSVDADVPIAIQCNNASNGNGEQINLLRVDVAKKNLQLMSNSNSIDLRGVQDVAKTYLTFLCNNSRSSSAQNNSWNERIEGFRIYMKKVDIIGGGLADEFSLLYDVDIKEGTYIMYGKDSDEEQLRLSDMSSYNWNATATDDRNAIVTSNLRGDSIKIPPALTYEALNGYKSDTTLAAMYKTSTVVQRKVYIGNIKIGNKKFPDRMIKTSADKFDIFPDDATSFIDVATSDGENIIKLESYNQYLLQFKEKTTYLIKVSSEGEDLIETWSGTGISHPAQAVKTPGGIFWVNNTGLFLYDGKQLNDITTKSFGIENWSVSENRDKPIILGYDFVSNKVLIITNNVTDTSNGGYIYDITNNSLTKCQNLFSWYPAFNENDEIKVQQEPA